MELRRNTRKGIGRRQKNSTLMLWRQFMTSYLISYFYSFGSPLKTRLNQNTIQFTSNLVTFYPILPSVAFLYRNQLYDSLCKSNEWFLYEMQQRAKMW